MFGPFAKRVRSKSDGVFDRVRRRMCGFNPSVSGVGSDVRSDGEGVGSDVGSGVVSGVVSHTEPRTEPTYEPRTKQQPRARRLSKLREQLAGQTQIRNNLLSLPSSPQPRNYDDGSNGNGTVYRSKTHQHHPTKPRQHGRTHHR